MNIDVSVIIPVYNVENYIGQCLDSILKQNHKNIEVIVVNDGSTDKSEDIIKFYEDKFDYFIYLKQDNKGVSEARNLALDYVRGEYILFVDPDDYLDVDCISDMLKKAINTNSDIVICGYKLVYDDSIVGRDKNILPNEYMNENYIYNGVEVAEKMLYGKFLGYLWNKLFKTSEIKRLKMKFDVGRYSQDWYPVFVQILNANKITCINKSLYNYRQRGSSTVNKKNEKIIKDYYFAISKIISYAKSSEINVDNNAVEVFKANAFNMIINMYSNLNFQKKNRIYYEFKQKEYCMKDINIVNLVILKQLRFKTKVSIILWKLKIRHLLKH